MSKNGILLSTAQDQNGKQPKIATPHDTLPADGFMVQVGRGKVPGTARFGGYGERITGGVETNRVVWPNGVFSLPGVSGVQMSIVSTVSTDTDGGTGINAVDIHYLDGNLNEQVEQVTLNGTTPVLTTATDIRFIQCMHGIVFGADAYADGDITASNGGTVYSKIKAMDTRCASSARMVPAGKYGYVAGASASATSGTSAARVKVRIAASELDEDQFLDPLALIPFGSIGVQDGSGLFDIAIPVRFSPGTVIAMTTTTDKTANVNGSWNGWLEDI